jgi:hypothetical protein
MDRQSSINQRTAELSPEALLCELLPALVAASIAAQLLIGIGLVMRRVSGAVSIASAPGWTVAWVLATAIVAATTRLLWFAWRRPAPKVVDWQVLCYPALALLFTALALSTVGMPLVFLVLLWLIVAVEEALLLLFLGTGVSPSPFDAFRLRRIVPRVLDSSRESKDDLHDRDRSIGGPGTRARDVRGAAEIQRARSPALPIRITSDRTGQCIERVQTASGCDRLVGTFMAYFAPGQTTAYIHVAFCPPFAAVPRVEHRQTGGPAARVKVGQVLPHGIRFDVKLIDPEAAPGQLVLEVRATIESGDAAPPSDE